MRPLEIVLIAGNMLGLLLAPSPFRQPWRGLAGVILVVLLVHAEVEGLRWQMTPAYLLAVTMGLLAAAKWKGKPPKAGGPRAFVVLTIVGAQLLLALTAFLASAFPVFQFPPLSGNYAVGTCYFHLVDRARREPFLEKTAVNRELMVKVYYPAEPDPSRPYSRYFRGSTRLLRALASFYQLPAFFLDHLALVRTRARDNLEVSAEEPRYPVVLLSHGAGASMEMETSQSQDMASHGYIAVAVDHPYVSAATLLPNRLVTAREATHSFEVPEPAELITQIMADDNSFVIDMLGRMNAGRIGSPFRGRLDLTGIGIIGHSVGGAAAYNLAVNDRRVSAAVNLDGVVYIRPRDPGTVAPFLMVANDRYHVQAIVAKKSLMSMPTRAATGEAQAVDRSELKKANANVAALFAVLARSETLYTVGGSDHMKFTDLGLFIGTRSLRELLQIGGGSEPARCLQITQALTLAFMDEHLKHRGPGLPALLRQYPELKRVPLN